MDESLFSLSILRIHRKPIHLSVCDWLLLQFISLFPFLFGSDPHSWHRVPSSCRSSWMENTRRSASKRWFRADVSRLSYASGDSVRFAAFGAQARRLTRSCQRLRLASSSAGCRPCWFGAFKPGVARRPTTRTEKTHATCCRWFSGDEKRTRTHDTDDFCAAHLHLRVKGKNERSTKAATVLLGNTWRKHASCVRP